MRFLFVISICFSCLTLAGQSGYIGKRFLVKTDLATPLLDKGFEAGIEATVLRNLSIYLKFETSRNQYEQFLEDYKLRFGEYPEELASINSYQFGLQFNYFSSKAVPAPKGTYWYSSINLGKADLEWNEFFHNNLFPDQEKYVQYRENGILSSKVELGIGFQEFAWKILVFDFNLGVNYGTLHLSNYLDNCDDCDFIRADYMGNFGPNLITLSRRASNNPGGVGVSIHARVGFLLF